MLTITLIRSGVSLTLIRYSDIEIFLLYKQHYFKTWYTIQTIVFNIFIEIMLATKRRCSQSFLNFLSDLSYSPFIYFSACTMNFTWVMCRQYILSILRNSSDDWRHRLFAFFDNFIPSTCIYRFTLVDVRTISIQSIRVIQILFL